MDQFFTLLTLSAVFLTVSASTILTDEVRLFNELFTNRQVNSSIRPVIDKKTPVQVVLDVAYVQLVDLSDKQQILKSSVWIRQEWINEFLTWDPKDYGGVTEMTVDRNLVWKPDLVLYNNAEEGMAAGVLDQFKTRVVITSKGAHKWNSPAILTSVCSIDISFFPFDYQICTLKFGSWTYLGHEINLTTKSPVADTSFYAASSQFNLMSLNAIRHVIYYSCCPDPYINIDYEIILKREPGFYLYNIMIPAVIITGFALCVFLFPEQTGSRMSLVFDCFLTLSIIAMMVSSLMPNDSTSTPLIAMFMLISMVQVTIAAFMTAACHNLDRETPLPFVLKHIVFKYLAPIVFVSTEEGDDDDDNDKASTSGSHQMTTPTRPLFLKSFNTCNRLLNVLHSMEGTNSDRLDCFSHSQFSSPKGGFGFSRQDFFQQDSETAGLEVVRNLDDLVRICLAEEDSEYTQDFWRSMSQICDRIFYILFCVVWTVVATALFLKIKPMEVA